MTDSMNFGPEWLRNLSSDGSTTGNNTGGIRYQLAEYRYGREEMLALFEKGLSAPPSLCTFSPLYSEQALPPLALVPSTEEDRQWPARGPPMGPSVRGGRGAVGPGERGGRIARGGRGSYQPYGRNVGYESGGGWGGVDNWRRSSRIEEDDGWRSTGHPGRGPEKVGEKWGRSSSWREGDDERGVQDKNNRSWHENQRGPQRRMWENEDHLPEWATENLSEGGGTFDASGAFHGSDDEQDPKNKREHQLQKSASQQNITSKTQHPPLSTSKSALSLSKPPEPPTNNKEDTNEAVNHVDEVEKIKPSNDERESKRETKDIPKAPSESKPHPNDNNREETNIPAKQKHGQNSNIDDAGDRVVDEDFDKLQEDLVLKLVVDEEPTNAAALVPHSNGVQPPPPPPNMMNVQEKWYYQDPQGDLQGPFLSTEMAEWFRAGYFTTSLFVRRQCDERFYTLGDLVNLCNGGNPFQTTIPIAPLKNEQHKLPDEMLQYQYMQHMALRGRTYMQGEPWNTVNSMQQREIMAQQLLAQQIPPEPYNIQQANTGNHLIHMLNQLNQVKMPVQPPIVEKPTNTIPCQLDPLQALVQQMGGLQPMQSRMQQATNINQSLGAPTQLKHETNVPTIHGLPVNGIPGPTVPVLPTNNLIANMQKAGIGKMDGDNNMNFLQFLQKQQQLEQTIDLDSLWRKNQFTPTQQSPPTAAQTQWQPTDKPISMWDMPTPPNLSNTPPEVQQMNTENTNITKQKQANDANKETTAKEEKKKKEQEEKQAKKEAEEKRKQEQKKQEAEKKLIEEKRKKEEERVKRELEKAKKESEEKRQRELAEKRRLKEQRKAEEEARKKAEELKKQEEVEKELAVKEREEQQKKQAEYTRQAMANNQKLNRVAPWSQAANSQGMSLAEIQKMERERKAEQVALMQKHLQQQQSQEQTSPEKPSSIHLNWANKPIKLNQVKSLSEIQAEEHERMQKQAQEKALQHKEKETMVLPVSRIWQGQTLTWTQNDNMNPGFWDEPQQKPSVNKINAENKIVKPSVNAIPKQVVNKPAKIKPKKDEQQMNNNSSSTDEFTEWCTKTLANMNTSVDIPTFISFLRDIESALDVREYCRDYLGDKPATQQFAAQFLEKRRLFKPKVTTHKDDMCSPAPAITPSMQHNNADFQEGKGKKVKKSKMFKVDKSILGFSVTAAQDRINVGDRDYGDTT